MGCSVLGGQVIIAWLPTAKDRGAVEEQGVRGRAAGGKGPSRTCLVQYSYCTGEKPGTLHALAQAHSIGTSLCVSCAQLQGESLAMPTEYEQHMRALRRLANYSHSVPPDN